MSRLIKLPAMLFSMGFLCFFSFQLTAQGSAEFNGKSRAWLTKPSFKASETQSIESWVYLDHRIGKMVIYQHAAALFTTESGSGNTATRYNGELQEFIEFGLLKGKPYLLINGKTRHIDDQAIDEKKWAHLACNYDGTMAQIFVDGVMVYEAKNLNESIKALNTATATFEFVNLGARANSIDASWNKLENDISWSNHLYGNLAQLRVWKTVRTTTEIFANRYNTITSETDLLASAPLDEIDLNDRLSEKVNNGLFRSYVESKFSTYAIFKRADQPVSIDDQNLPVLKFGLTSAYNGKYQLKTVGLRIHAPKKDSALSSANAGISAVLLKKGYGTNNNQLPTGFEKRLNTTYYIVTEKDNKDDGIIWCYFDLKTLGIGNLNEGTYHLLNTKDTTSDYVPVEIQGLTLNSTADTAMVKMKAKDLKSGIYTFGITPNAAGTALDLDGNNQYASVEGLRLSSSFTIECWAKPSSTTKFPLFSHGEQTNTSGFVLEYDGYLEKLNFGLKTGITTISNSSLGNADWMHFALSYNSGNKTFTIYLNGQVVGSKVASTAYSATTDLYVGKSILGNNHAYFEGNIDELRIWDKAIPTAEIASNYDRLRQIGSPALLHYYAFNVPLSLVNNCTDYGSTHIPLIVNNATTSNSTLSLKPASIPTAQPASKTKATIKGSTGILSDEAGGLRLESSSSSVHTEWELKSTSNTIDVVTIASKNYNTLKRQWTVTSRVGNVPAHRFTFKASQLGINAFDPEVNYILLCNDTIAGAYTRAYVNQDMDLVIEYPATIGLRFNGTYTLAWPFDFNFYATDDDCIGVDLTTSLDEYTLEFAFRLGSATWTNKGLFAFNSSKEITIDANSNYLKVAPGLKSTTALVTEKWYHCAITSSKSKGQSILYIDGIAENDINQVAALRGFAIFDYTAQDISLDDLRIWKGIRTPEQIKTNAKIQTVPAYSKNLVAQYNFQAVGSSNNAPELDERFIGKTLATNPSISLNTVIPSVGNRYWAANLYLKGAKSVNSRYGVVGGLVWGGREANMAGQQHPDMEVYNRLWYLNPKDYSGSPHYVDFSFQTSSWFNRMVDNKYRHLLLYSVYPDKNFVEVPSVGNDQYPHPNHDNSLNTNYERLSMTILDKDFKPGYYKLVRVPNDWGNALAFDGVDDHVKLDSLNLWPKSDLSLSCWVRGPGKGTIFSKTNSQGDGVSLGFDNIGRLKATLGGQIVYTWTVSWPKDQFNHLALVQSSDSLTLWLNGKPYGGRTISNPASAKDHPAILGALATTTISNYFQGEIDEFRIWNTALKPHQIRNYAHATLQTYYSYERFNRSPELKLLPYRFSFNHDNASEFGSDVGQTAYGELVNMNARTAWRKTPKRPFFYEATELSRMEPAFSNQEEIINVNNAKSGFLVSPLNGLEVRVAHNNSDFLKPNKEDFMLTGSNNIDFSWQEHNGAANIKQILEREWLINVFDDDNDGGDIYLDFITNDLSSTTFTYTLLHRSRDGEQYSPAKFKTVNRKNEPVYVNGSYNRTDVFLEYVLDAKTFKSGYYTLGKADLGKTFSASDDSSDSKIYVKYNIPAKCFVEADMDPVVIQVSKSDKQIVHELKLDSFSWNSVYPDSFVYHVEPETMETFKLSMYQVGPGTEVCKDMFQDDGSTAKHQPPSLYVDSVFTHKTQLFWINHSDLNNAYRLRHTRFSDSLDNSGKKVKYSVETLLLLDSTQNSFVDSVGGTLNMQNGDSCVYCLQVQSTRFGKFYDSSCVNAKTVPLSFSATDNVYTDQVKSTWNLVDNYCDEMLLFRDGSVYARLKNSATQFTDKTPIPGKQHEYRLELYQNNQEILEVSDFGSVEPVGTISGSVLTLSGNYAVPNCTITASAILAGQDYEYSTTTDSLGAYKLSNIYFGINGTYTLTASKNEHVFSENDHEVALSTSEPNGTQSFASTYTYKQSTSNLTGFTYSKTNQPNYVQLTCKHDKKPTIFQLYRNNVLIAIAKDENGEDNTVFIDSTAEPGTTYEYRINAYQLSNGLITEKDESFELKTMNLLAIKANNVQLAADAFDGVIRLKWEYAGKHATGVQILRDTDTIAHVTNDDSYIDLGGENGKEHTYYLSVYKEIDGTRFYASTASKKGTYPTLKSPNPVGKLQASLSNGSISGNVTHGLGSDYNFDGVELLRATSEHSFHLATVVQRFPKGNDNYSFVDSTVGYNHTWWYVTRTYRNNSLSQNSGKANKYISYYPSPKITELRQVTTNGGPDVFELKWDPQTVDLDSNRISFTDSRGTHYKTLPPGKNQAYLGVVGTDASIVFQVANYKYKNGKQEYLWDNKSIWAWKNGISSKIDNFQASNSNVGFVNLTWNYPSYITNHTYQVYRDDVLIGDKVPHDARFFIDSNATPNRKHVYSIRSVTNSGTTTDYSQWSYAYGNTTASYYVSGQVLSKNGNGIGNVLVAAASNGNVNERDVFYRSAISDKTGYFLIRVPKLQGLKVKLKATGDGAFSEPTIAFNDSTSSYQQNIVDQTKTSETKTELKVAEIKDFLATADQLRQLTVLRFNVSSRNYTGIEIMRGARLLTTITRSNGLNFEDSTGLAGFTYRYTAKAYWEVDGKKQFSNTKTVTVDYPSIPAVENLKATVNIGKNKVRLQWTHPTELLDRYHIYRDGELIGNAKQGRFQYDDLKGTPGAKHRYTITAVIESSAGISESTPIAATADFPLLPKVQDLELTVLTNENAINLTWKNEIERVAGYIITRQNRIFDTIARQSNRSTYSFKDDDGTPTARTTYGVFAYLVVNGESYNAPTNYVAEVYPSLATVQNFSINPMEGADMVRINWDYEADNVDGYLVYRNGVEMASLPISQKYFTDENGVPNTTYTYAVRVFANRNSRTYYSALASSSAKYPEVSAPKSLWVSQNESKLLVLLNWKQPDWLTALKEERGYEIEARNWAVNTAIHPIANEPTSTWTTISNSVPYGNRYYANINPTLQENQQGAGGNIYDIACDQYRIRSYRIINGIKYYSNYVKSERAGHTLYGIYDNYKPTNASASQSTYKGYVRLNWTDDNSSTNTGYHIYRRTYTSNYVKIASIDKGKEVYADNNVEDGVIYIYEIRPATNSNQEYGTALLGWSAPQGVIKGSAITSQNSTPIVGANILATAIINNQLFAYKTATNANGEYEINNVFAKGGTKYKIAIDFDGQVFENDVLVANFSQSDGTENVKPFLGLNEYTVEGHITYENSQCGLDSVNVQLVSHYSDGSTGSRQGTTNKNGFYSIPFNPFATDLLKVDVVPDTFKVYPSRTNGDTVSLLFSKRSMAVASPASVANTTIINFEELSTVSVHVALKNSCGPVPGNGQFAINVRSKNGKFSEVFSTDTRGQLDVQLPPLDYEFLVAGVNPINADNYPYLEQFSSSVRTLSFSSAKDGDKDTINYMYYGVPKISSSGLNSFCQNDASQPAIVATGEEYTLTLNASEQQFGGCPVSNGFLMVYNEATRDGNPETLLLNKKTGRFNTYTFTPNNPNATSPYTRTIRVEYHTKSKGFMSELLIPLIVEGTATIPGSDVFVNPSENDQVPLPLFVLRDPPGDGSYSYITEKSKHSQKIVFEKSTMLDYSGYVKASFAVPVGIKTDFTWGYNKKDGNKYTYDVTSTFNKKITTAKTSNALNKNRDGYLQGEDADVIVGAGLVSQYGLSWNIKVADQQACKVDKKETIAIGPGGIKTTWVYTVDHIKGLIEEYKGQLEKVKNGQLVFTNSDGENEAKEVSLAKFEAYISNWQKVLRFHEIETKPHVCLCNKIYNEKLQPPYDEYLMLEDLPEKNRKEAITLIKTKFCDKIGSFDNDTKTFELSGDFIWEQDLIHRYNAIQAMISSWEKHEDMFLKIIKDFKEQDEKIDGDWAKAYSAQFEPEAQNITFGGGASYQEEMTVSRSRAHSDLFSDYNYYNFYIGLVVQFKMGATIFGYSTTPVHIDGDLGFRYKKTDLESFSSTYSEDSSATVGYVLSDDDPGDQYSVTVVEGLNDNQTPYFSLLGGRSSCPHQNGTINRDLFALQLFNREDKPVSPVQRFLAPDKPAIFTVKVTNNNAFGEKRTLKLTNAANSNTYGAIVTAAGASLANGLSFNLNANESAYVDVIVDRGNGVFAHEDIKLMLKSTCNDISSESIELKAYWEHPCTDVDIISDNNFVIYSNPNGPERYSVILGGYDVYNELLEKVELKYRRIGDTKWTTFEVIERDELLESYEKSKTVPARPAKYALDWNIKGDKSIINGTYEIVAEYTCENMGALHSNVVQGVVDRSSFRFIGMPSPTDGILSLGEPVKAAYNKIIAEFKLENNHYRVSYEDDGQTRDLLVPVQANQNELWFAFSDSLRMALAGKRVSITIDSLWEVNGRFHEEPATWTFTISNNFLYWSPTSLTAATYSGSKTSVKALLKYTRFDKAESYNLFYKDSSSWLSSTQMNGIAALTGQEIQFDIDASSLAPGIYKDIIIAQIADFDDIELPIELHVARKKPNWQVDPSQFEHSLHAITNYNIAINGSNIRSKDTLDLIAAFIGSELRGVSRIGHYGSNYAAYLPIYGNTSDQGKTVHFRVWRAEDGKMYDAWLDNNDKITFDLTKQLIGTLVNPRILYINAKSDVIRKIPLKKGWNWLSLNVQQQTLEQALLSLKVEDGDVIKTLTSSSEFTTKFGKGGQWISTNGLTNIAPENGYLLHISHADTLLISGAEASNNVLNINTGWNLIGFPEQASTLLSSPSITSVTNGDIFKSQTQVAVYNGGWNGSLNKLEPFQAYKLRVGQKGKVVFKKTPRPENWEVDPSAFEFNMTVTARLLFDGNPSIDTNDIVGAFVDGELRGMGKVHWLPAIQKYRVVLFVYSNEVADENITFQLFDNDKELLYNAHETIEFEADKRLGKLSDPYLLSDVPTTGVKVATWIDKQMSVYPNPTTGDFSIQFESNINANYELIITDVMGRQIFSQKLVATSGRNRVLVNTEEIGLSKGIYSITLQSNSVKSSIKLIKE